MSKILKEILITIWLLKDEETNFPSPKVSFKPFAWFYELRLS